MPSYKNKLQGFSQGISIGKNFSIYYNLAYLKLYHFKGTNKGINIYFIEYNFARDTT